MKSICMFLDLIVALHVHFRIGPGDPSRIVTSKTNGSMPIMPPQSMLLQNISATHVTLNLASWLTDGCPITKFSVRYQVWGDDVWHTVATDISSKEVKFLHACLHAKRHLKTINE